MKQSTKLLSLVLALVMAFSWRLLSVTLLLLKAKLRGITLMTLTYQPNRLQTLHSTLATIRLVEQL